MCARAQRRSRSSKKCCTATPARTSECAVSLAAAASCVQSCIFFTLRSVYCKVPKSTYGMQPTVYGFNRMPCPAQPPDRPRSRPAPHTPHRLSPSSDRSLAPLANLVRLIARASSSRGPVIVGRPSSVVHGSHVSGHGSLAWSAPAHRTCTSYQGRRRYAAHLQRRTSVTFSASHRSPLSGPCPGGSRHSRTYLGCPRATERGMAFQTKTLF